MYLCIADRRRPKVKLKGGEWAFTSVVLEIVNHLSLGLLVHTMLSIFVWNGSIQVNDSQNRL